MSDSETETSTPQTVHDIFNLKQRFIKTHRRYFPQALEEIKQGSKRSCWSWYIFPTGPWVVNGVERGSYTNQLYALRDQPPNHHRGEDAARAFLTFPTVQGVCLRENYLRMMTEVGNQLEAGLTATQLVGGIDKPKLQSSLVLFESVSRGFDPEVNSVCRRALTLMKVSFDSSSESDSETESEVEDQRKVEQSPSKPEPPSPQ